jgi:aldehyde dehydrogenase (NAD+)
MREHHELYIDGSWRAPLDPTILELVDPATGEPNARISLGGEADIDAAVAAAERSFTSYSQTTPQQRIALLERVLAEFDARAEDLAQAVSEELGAPLALARGAHVPSGRVQIATAIEVLKTFEFTEMRGSTEVRKEALGVAGLITPWNFPVLQPIGKTVSALAAGSTAVLKPAQLTPYSAIILAEILAAAGTPAGVFNLVNGRGSVAGARLSSHPSVGVVSFTGSLAAQQWAPFAPARLAMLYVDDADIAAQQLRLREVGEVAKGKGFPLFHQAREFGDEVQVWVHRKPGAGALVFETTGRLAAAIAWP